MHDITYMWNLKNNTNEPSYKTETDLQTQKTNLWLPKGKWGGINQGFGVNRHENQSVSCSVVSYSLQPHELQHARRPPPHPSD